LRALKKIALFCVSSLLVLGTNLGRADDTEIYFNSTSAADVEVIRSNVLFILDTSGSMTSPIPGSGLTRMDALKEAMENLLLDTEDVNVALARYKFEFGGSIIFPMSDIDGKSSELVGDIGDSTVSEIINTAFIKNDLDDGEEIVTASSETGAPPVGDVSLTDPILDAFDFGGTQSFVGSTQTFDLLNSVNDAMEETSPGDCAKFFINNANKNRHPIHYTGVHPISSNKHGIFIHRCVLAALRFPSVTLAQGVGIDQAFIDFVASTNENKTIRTTIVGQDVDDAASMPDGLFFDNDISSRQQTTAFQDWNVQPVSRNNTVTTPDIGHIVQEIVNRPGWASGQSMFFRFQDGGAPLDTTSSNVISGLSSLTRGGSGNGRRIFFNREVSPGNGARLRVATASSGTAVQGQDQMIALRFTDVRIPKGASLTEVKLVLTPKNSPVTPLASNWSVGAEQVDDSSPLIATSSNISSRATGTKVNWTIGTEDLKTADSPEKSIDIKSVVQQVINRSGWCGGNALTIILDTTSATANQTRFLHSRDSDSTKAPRLTYKFGAGATGCVKAREIAQTGLSGDDAEQFEVNVDTIDNDLDLGFDTESGLAQTVGLRFRNLDIPKGVNILDARIVFTSKGISEGDSSFIIRGIAEDNVAAFSNTTNDITDRPTTSSVISWVPDDWSEPATAFPTDDVTPIVQEIVNRGGWASGNTMGFVIEGAGGYYSNVNPRVAETADGDVSKSPRLKVTYQSTIETPFKTNRDRLIEVINGLPADGFTPIVPTLVEAAKYWRGEKVFHGKKRNNIATNRLSHPGTYCSAAGSCNGAQINSNSDAFGVKKLSGCDMLTNPDSNNCKSREIRGNPRYISPFNTDLTCATNHQVFLTDGFATDNNNANRNYVKSLPGVANCRTRNDDIFRASEGEINMFYFPEEQCAVELAEFLHRNDQSSTINNRQIVKTHTIAFADGVDSFVDQYMKDIANVGGGEFHKAKNASELVDVFENILSQVKNDPTSFVSPALATNAFNRLLSRDEVYFGLFTPDLARAWHGNVKKYNICVESGGCSLGSIIDANDLEAVDSSTDKFKDSAQSIWSSVVDGQATTQGGTGHEITNFQNQTIYTDRNNSALASNGQLLSGAGFELKFDNWHNTDFTAMRSAVCPTPSTSGGSDCEKRMLFLLGKKNTTDPETDISGTQRWSVNDVLHSSPVVITYRGFDTNGDGEFDKFFDKLIYGSNDGAVHMVNGDSGAEEWRFIPSDFWSTQQDLFTNAEGEHTYGLDVTPTVQVIDIEDNGSIDVGDGDKVRAFIASRRGGSGIYALDLTHDIPVSNETFAPRFLWRIRGGSGDFPRLGQSWSKPVLATVEIDTGTGIENREVLIFGGGYDAALDNPETYSVSDHAGVPFLGNAIYIVDPANGDLLLAISGSPGGADIVVPGMDYSIPSSVTALDTDIDGAVDRIYVGDTGGQVWRVDLAAIEIGGTYSSAAGNTVVGKLAEISADGLPVKHRRFFEPPSVVQVRDNVFANEENYDYVLMGTGYRAHPLNKQVEDRFYAFRDFQTGANEMRDDNGDNFSGSTEAYPQPNGNAFTDADMIDVTTTILDSSVAEHRSSAGWFYDFTQAGTVAEKVLSPAITTAGIVTFTTFAPEETSASDPCGALLGLGKAYNFDILSGGAALDWDNDGAITNNDRVFDLSSGIPSGVVPVFTNEGVIGIVGVEGGAKQLGKLSELLTERSYWYEGAEF